MTALQLAERLQTLLANDDELDVTDCNIDNDDSCNMCTVTFTAGDGSSFQLEVLGDGPED